MSFCRKCGAKLGDGDKFCRNCGSRIADDSEPKIKLFIQIAAVSAALLLAIAALIFVLTRMNPDPPDPITDLDTPTPTEMDTFSASEDSATIVADSTEDAESFGALDKTDKEEEPENAAVATEDLVREVIGTIENQPEYSENSTWKPLCVADDFNGDGVQEFLAVYEKEADGLPEVDYDIWSLPETGAVKIKSDTLFIEVGGSNGSVGIVKGADGVVYLGIVQSKPTGSTSDVSEMYWPWNPEKSALDQATVFLQSHEIIDIPGNSQSQGYDYYILGDTKVDKAAFDKRKNDFSNWVYQLQFTQGPSGGVSTFNDFK